MSPLWWPLEIEIVTLEHGGFSDRDVILPRCVPQKRGALTSESCSEGDVAGSQTPIPQSPQVRWRVNNCWARQEKPLPVPAVPEVITGTLK